MDKQMTEPLDASAMSRLDLLFLTQAYNRGELSLEQWLQLSKEWAEAMQRRYNNGSNEETKS